MNTVNRFSFARVCHYSWRWTGLEVPASPYVSPRAALAQDFESKKIVPFVPTPQEVVDKMIELAGVKAGDVVYDLGSGDGRIVITAAKKAPRPWDSMSMALSSKNRGKISERPGLKNSPKSDNRIS